MDCLRFDEEALAGELGKLPPRFRVVFAAACAERLKPAYAEFAKHTGQSETDPLAPMLARLWVDLIDDPMTAEEVQAYIERCKSLIPNGRDADWIESQEQAEDAALALYYAFRCRQNRSAHEAAWAARRVYTGLADLARDSNPRRGDPAAVPRHSLARAEAAREEARALLERARASPIVQAELARQRRDINDLLSIEPSGDPTHLIMCIRDRARAESSSVFG